MPVGFPDHLAALIIAHPGHELRVYGWLNLARPRVFVLTDGSGRSGRSRLPATSRILTEIGIETGCVYGRLTDAEIYSAIMNREWDLFLKLARELARTLAEQRIDFVVGDAFEGYNPAHDVCRLMINAAVEIVNRSTGHSVANFDILLTGKSADCSEGALVGSLRIDLDEEMVSRKLKVAREYSELADEVDRVLKEEGTSSIGTECLRRVAGTGPSDLLIDSAPYYERYGEQQVAAGYYRQVLRYREHMLPLAERLRQAVEGGDDGPNASSHHQ